MLCLQAASQTKGSIRGRAGTLVIMNTQICDLHSFRQPGGEAFISAFCMHCRTILRNSGKGSVKKRKEKKCDILLIACITVGAKCASFQLWFAENEWKP